MIIDRWAVEARCIRVSRPTLIEPDDQSDTKDVFQSMTFVDPFLVTKIVGNNAALPHRVAISGKWRNKESSKQVSNK